MFAHIRHTENPPELREASEQGRDRTERIFIKTTNPSGKARRIVDRIARQGNNYFRSNLKPKTAVDRATHLAAAAVRGFKRDFVSFRCQTLHISEGGSCLYHRVRWGYPINKPIIGRVEFWL